MSDLTFNKIAGGVLLTGLIIFGLKEASDIVFAKHELEKPGYEIAVAEEAGAGGAAAEVAPDWGSVLTPANVTAGQAVSAKCASCHNFTPENHTGPGLFGVVGRKPGTHPGFAYSPAMVEYGNKNPVWDYDKLDTFLKAPGKDVSGTKMTFVGLKKQEDRIAIIAYLHSLGSSLPIPAPKPAGAAPAAPAAAAGEAPAVGTAAAGSAPVPAAVGAGGAATGPTPAPNATKGSGDAAQRPGG
jgi:cytochrome c